MIDSRSIIHKSVLISNNVNIGPFSIIGENVEIGANSCISSHVIVGDNTIIGNNNKIYQFSSIGEIPIDYQYRGEWSQLRIGNNNTIREHSVIHSGTSKGDRITRFGNNNLVMNYVHIGHDCRIGDNVVIINGSSLAGHVQIDDFVTIGAYSQIHQFCRVGCYSFLSHKAVVTKDIPPFLIFVGSNELTHHGVNIKKMQESCFSIDTISSIKKAYKLLYRKGLNRTLALEMLKSCDKSYEIKVLTDFFKNSKRGVIG